MNNIKVMGDSLEQRDQITGPRAIFGPRPLLTRTAKLLVNMILATTTSFIFFTLKGLKKKPSFECRLMLRVNANEYKALR
jgi:hypothetical protein